MAELIPWRTISENKSIRFSKNNPIPHISNHNKLSENKIKEFENTINKFNKIVI